MYFNIFSLIAVIQELREEVKILQEYLDTANEELLVQFHAFVVVVVQFVFDPYVDMYMTMPYSGCALHSSVELLSNVSKPCRLRRTQWTELSCFICVYVIIGHGHR